MLKKIDSLELERTISLSKILRADSSFPSCFLPQLSFKDACFSFFSMRRQREKNGSSNDEKY